MLCGSHIKISNLENHMKKQNKKHQNAKGQLISKGRFGILNSSKKQTKNLNLSTMIPQVALFLFVFVRI